MTTTQYQTTNEWVALLKKILSQGSLTQVRGLSTLEILGNQTRIPMSHPTIMLRERRLGYKFMVAEAWWILTGQNTVETIRRYSNAISRFSDDGVYYNGAYGPKIVDQLTYIVDSLHNDIHCRQAVINIWRENPRPSKDIPCTLSLQFFVRSNRLHCSATMRSSDAWLGWVYDVFNFSLITAYIRELLIKRNRELESLELGDLVFTAGSQHIYSTDFEAIADVLNSVEEDEFPYYPGHPAVTNTVDIISYLKFMKDYGDDRVYVGGAGFLDALFEHVYFRKGLGES